jgi:hypothetical protein
MRVFGDEEKKIIRKINAGDGLAKNLINIFESIKHLPHVRVKVDKASMTAELLFECQASQSTSDEIEYAIGEHKNIIEKLIVHLVLLRHLEKEELAFFFEPAQNSQNVIEFGAGAVNMHSYTMAIDDATLIKLLAGYVNKEIVPAPALRHLEKNDFRSDEERRFIRQQVNTWSAIAVTLFIGLLGIYNGYQAYSFQKVQAEQSSEKFNEMMDAINIAFDSINASELYPHSELKRIANEISQLNLAIESASKSSPESEE